MRLLRLLTGISCFFYYSLYSSMSPEESMRYFIFETVGSIKKFQPFVYGEINNQPILSIVLQLLQENKSKDDIATILLNKNYFIYRGKKEILQSYKNLLVEKNIGFVAIIKNLVAMFFILEKGLLAADQQLIKQDNEGKLSSLSITKEHFKWAIRELIIELNFKIKNFLNERPVDKTFTWKNFVDWLNELDQTMFDNHYESWASHVNKHNFHKNISSKIIYSVKDIIFLMKDYIPVMMLLNDKACRKITWDDLKTVFPDFDEWNKSYMTIHMKNEKAARVKEFFITLVNYNFDTICNRM